MSRIPYHKRYHGDILTAYMGMSLEERGAYDTLLELMYDRGGDIPNDMRWIGGWFGTSTRKATSLITTLLSSHKIYLSAAGTFRNRRTDNELENLAEISRTQAERRLKPKDNSPLNLSPSSNFKDLEKPGLNGGLTNQNQIQNQIEHKPSNTAAIGAAREEDPKPDLALVPTVGRRVLEAMGVMDDPNWQGNWSLVSVWLAQGFDADLDIMPAVLSIVEKRRQTREPMPRSLKYFTPIIRDNHQQRLNGKLPAAAAKHVEFATVKRGSKEFKAWIAYYRAQGLKTQGYENQDLLTVPSPFPPSQMSAA